MPRPCQVTLPRPFLNRDINILIILGTVSVAVRTGELKQSFGVGGSWDVINGVWEVMVLSPWCTFRCSNVGQLSIKL